MPRMARKVSSTKVYHIIFRGNDKQDIFFDMQDYKKYLKEIKVTKEKYQYEILAYCLMSNHAHLIVFDKNDNLSKAMQSLAVAYSSYFSKKYDKVGHLFQNRFLSKNVETKEYLLQLCRYIHQNPTKAKIAEVDNYKWSSYKEYINLDLNERITNINTILPMFGSNIEQAIKNFETFHKYENEDYNKNEYVEFEIVDKLTDEELKQAIEKILNIENSIEIKKYNSNIRDKCIIKLKNIKGTTKTQIARVTGINRKIIERAINKE